MKSFVLSVVAAVAIAAVAGIALTMLGWDSASVYQSANVRL